MQHSALAEDWLDCYFRGEKPLILELTLAPEGSEFRREVWKLRLLQMEGAVLTGSGKWPTINAGQSPF